MLLDKFFENYKCLSVQWVIMHHCEPSPWITHYIWSIFVNTQEKCSGMADCVEAGNEHSVEDVDEDGVILDSVE